MLDEWKRQTYIFMQGCRFNEIRAEHEVTLAKLKGYLIMLGGK